jgi:amino acid adenylation domain-containing protein
MSTIDRAGVVPTAEPRPHRVGPFPVPPHLVPAIHDPDTLVRCAAALARRRLPGGAGDVRIVHRGREYAPPRAPTGAGPVTVEISGGDEATVSAGPDEVGARRWASWFLRLLAETADRPAPMPPQRVVMAPFEAQVARSPHAVAVADEAGRSVTYRELHEAANQLAHHLLELGAGPGGRVGIAVPRGIAQVVAIHATVQAGATYVPLDTDLPAARLAFIAVDADVAVILSGGDPGSLAGGPWRLVDVEADRSEWDHRPRTPPAVPTGPEALLHILYTSGTTGRPKGVAYPACGVADHLVSMQSRYPFLPGDTALAKTSPGFDVSVWELFWPLYHGARLVTCRPGGHTDPAHLARLVDRHGVTNIFLPPTVMAPFLVQARSPLPTLRWGLCGGEPVTPRIRDLFHATAPGAELANCYGPTEAGSVTDGLLERRPGSPVPLGHPQGHFRVHLLDEELRPVHVGTPGEAFIGSRTGLADCYWRAPARTAERFVADPYGGPGARMYRTGDLLRRREDGLLEHLGRIDRQLKIAGMRIEPGEVEAVLAEHPAVTDSAVVADGDPPRLLAFVVPPDGGDVDVAALAEHAAALLPAHMRPSAVVAVPMIPATANGKIDRDALLRMAAGRRAGRERAVDGPEAAFVAIVERVLGGPAGPADTFLQLGGTSLTAAEVLAQCERSFAAIPDVRLLFGGTLRDVAGSLQPGAAS